MEECGDHTWCDTLKALMTIVIVSFGGTLGRLMSKGLSPSQHTRYLHDPIKGGYPLMGIILRE